MSGVRDAVVRDDDDVVHATNYIPAQKHLGKRVNRSTLCGRARGYLTSGRERVNCLLCLNEMFERVAREAEHARTCREWEVQYGDST